MRRGVAATASPRPALLWSFHFDRAIRPLQYDRTIRRFHSDPTIRPLQCGGIGIGRRDTTHPPKERELLGGQGGEPGVLLVLRVHEMFDLKRKKTKEEKQAE